MPYPLKIKLSRNEAPVEGYGYDPEVVRNALPENKLLLTNGNKVLIENVGYYHNANGTAAADDDFVFFLPKVVLNKDDRVFVTKDNPLGFSPEELINPDKLSTTDGRMLTDPQRDFLYEFSVWIYRALSLYLETHPDTGAVWATNDQKSGAFKRKYVSNTFLDVILALIRFNRDNQDYLRFKIREKHSGLDKISWPRTIAFTPAVISKGVPVYLNPVNRSKSVDFDEELLVIYYSILAYVHAQYKFPVQIDMGYELIQGERFRLYLNGYGVARLRQIKYKYFADRDLILWDLCFAFFDKVHQANIAATGENYLLAKNFEIVFEAMIDDLLGDSELTAEKSLSDGKEIDHLYADESLTRTDGWRTLCIADSKYYKIGNALEEKSVAKQFTYARNMLQLNLDLFLYDKDEVSDKVKKWRQPFEDKRVRLLRDEVTEGYDILPNFFISAFMDEKLDYEHDSWQLRQVDDNGEFHNIHFENRLFDRDTLILSHFNVNFLYVLKLYVQNDDSAQRAWKESTHKMFRDKIRDLISHRYELCAIMPHEGIDASQFFRENFKATAGKVYAPYQNDGGRQIYALALQKADYILRDIRLSQVGLDQQVDRIRNENRSAIELIESSFYVVRDVPFGEDPLPMLKDMADKHPVVHAPAADVTTGVQVVTNVSGPLTQAIRKTGLFPCPVSQCPNAEAVRLLIVPFTQCANLFHVVEGTTPERVAAASLAQGSFAGVAFPDKECWVWRVYE